jgi:hypothetical protein
LVVVEAFRKRKGVRQRMGVSAQIEDPAQWRRGKGVGRRAWKGAPAMVEEAGWR